VAAVVVGPHDLGHLGVGGGGGERGRPEGRDAQRHLDDQLGLAADGIDGIGGRHDPLGRRPLGDGHGLVVADEAHVEHLLEQLGLRAERREHGLAGDVGGPGDVVDRDRHVAPFEEQRVGRVADASAGLARLVGAQRGAVAARGVDGIGHFSRL
jgi:hypothetical protein